MECKKQLHRAVHSRYAGCVCAYFDGNIKYRRVQEKIGFIYSRTNENIYRELMDGYRTEHVYFMTKE